MAASDDINSSIQAIYSNKAFVNSITSDASRFGIILDKTNFYGESGGQMNDTGSITIDGKADFCVEDVQVFGRYVLHIGYLKYGSLSVKDTVVCSFDEVLIFMFFRNTPSFDDGLCVITIPRRTF